MNTYIDHTLLRADATALEIERLCHEAISHQFATVCVNSSFVKLASEILNNSDVVVCSVIGFPLGASSTASKIEEAKQALADGASEIDMVIHQGKLKEKDFQYVENDIRFVKQAIGNQTLKVILEICNLTDEETTKASQLAENAGADFIKTSTGFGSYGATLEAVKLMKESVSDSIKIKASGGIRDAATAQDYINLGVSRIGTSSGIAIVSGTSSNSIY